MLLLKPILKNLFWTPLCPTFALDGPTSLTTLLTPTAVSFWFGKILSKSGLSLSQGSVSLVLSQYRMVPLSITLRFMHPILLRIGRTCGLNFSPLMLLLILTTNVGLLVGILIKSCTHQSTRMMMAQALIIWCINFKTVYCKLGSLTSVIWVPATHGPTNSLLTQ